MSVCVHVCLCACTCVCVRMCMRVCVCLCVLLVLKSTSMHFTVMTLTNLMSHTHTNILLYNAIMQCGGWRMVHLPRIGGEILG